MSRFRATGGEKAGAGDHHYKQGWSDQSHVRLRPLIYLNTAFRTYQRPPAERLVSRADTDTTKTAAPSAAAESKSHSTEQADGVARALAVGVFTPDVQVLDLDDRISVGGFVKAACFLAGNHP